MKVRIEFCMMWNFAPKAASLAEDLFNHFRTQISSLELIPSSGGVFEIEVNGENLYSKKATGEFPDHDLIIKELAKLKA